MDNQFTLGPWFVEKDDFGSLMVSPPGRKIPHNREAIICGIVHRKGNQVATLEDKANARLIAAAPCMFKIVEKLAEEGNEEAKQIVDKVL